MVAVVDNPELAAIIDEQHRIKPAESDYKARQHDACGVGIETDLKALAKAMLRYTSRTSNPRKNFSVHIPHWYVTSTGSAAYPYGTGDGTGITTDIPVDFYNDVMQSQFGTKKRYEFGEFGIMQLFLPKTTESPIAGGPSFEQLIKEMIGEDPRFKFEGLRDTPINPGNLTQRARQTMPRIKQAFFTFAEGLSDEQKTNLCTELFARIDTKFANNIISSRHRNANVSP